MIFMYDVDKMRWWKWTKDHGQQVFFWRERTLLGADGAFRLLVIG
jgi:hypothetical protein